MLPEITQYYLTKNNCYITNADKPRLPKGFMLHSTGANNPNLRRYIGPDDGILGFNLHGNHWNQIMDRNVCYHAMIGKDKNGKVRIYQCLPWDIVGWHSGSGSKGFSQNANNTGYIGVGICEDGLTDPAYFAEVYGLAVGLCACLADRYGFATTSPAVIDHAEGHRLGMASNHADVGHWLPRHGKNMNTFRADVVATINEWTADNELQQLRAENARLTNSLAKKTNIENRLYLLLKQSLALLDDLQNIK